MSKVATLLLLLAACAHAQEVCEAISGNCSDADDFAALQSQMRQVGRHVMPTLPPATTALPYDCNAGWANWQLGWSEQKKAWCCLNLAMGCPGQTTPPPDTTALLFDCNEGWTNWQLGWSEQKKRWCCLNFSKGCPDQVSTSPPPASTCPAGFVEGPACSGSQICPDGHTCGGGKCGCYIPCNETANCQPGNECCPTGACAASGLTCGGEPNVPTPPPPTLPPPACPAGFVEGPACSGSQICPDGHTCGGGKCGCYIPCTETANCQPGNECCPTGACAASGLTCGGAPNVGQPPPPPPTSGSCPAGFVEGPYCTVGEQFCPDGSDCLNGKCGCYIPCTTDSQCQPGNACCGGQACAASGIGCRR